MIHILPVYGLRFRCIRLRYINVRTLAQELRHSTEHDAVMSILMALNLLSALVAVKSSFPPRRLTYSALSVRPSVSAPSGSRDVTAGDVAVAAAAAADIRWVVLQMHDCGGSGC